MPRQEIDYFKTVIYKIVCRDLSITECYIGSTTEFRRRKSAHRGNCKKNEIQKLYNFINSNGGWDNWDMIEIEKFPCMDSNEKRRRERYWVEDLKATLNMIKPCSIGGEREEYMKNYMNIYQEKNKEKLKEYQKNYRNKNT